MLIAEIGNNHFGDFESAKKHILAAHESGADAVKMQAFKARDLVGGSMPPEFYQKCQFSFAQYKDLIDFGKERGIDVFYSIFSEELWGLVNYQKYKKFSGKQTARAITDNKYIDYKNTFVSFPKDYIMAAVHTLNARPLYATAYLPTDPELFYLDYLAKVSKVPYGYSDHTVGIKACELAVKEFGARIVEKHFTLEKNRAFNGQVFRDTIHAANPDEFYALKKMMGVL